MLVSAGRERKSAGKAIDGGGIGIVTIVSIHIISSQLLYLAFRRKLKDSVLWQSSQPPRVGGSKKRCGTHGPFPFQAHLRVSI